MDNYLGQILAFGFNFAPKGWAQCNGQLMSISQNSALYSLLGTTFGGDGINTFGLPDLRGRVAINQGSSPGGSSYVMGQVGGQEQVTLSILQIPSHTHTAVLRGNSEGATSNEPSNKSLGAGANIFNSNPPENGEALNINSIQVDPTGGNQPHENMQPYLTVNYCIALQGIYPSRS